MPLSKATRKAMAKARLTNGAVLESIATASTRETTAFVATVFGTILAARVIPGSLDSELSPESLACERERRALDNGPEKHRNKAHTTKGRPDVHLRSAAELQRCGNYKGGNVDSVLMRQTAIGPCAEYPNGAIREEFMPRYRPSMTAAEYRLAVRDLECTVGRPSVKTGTAPGEYDITKDVTLKGRTSERRSMTRVNYSGTRGRLSDK